jgi:hypothetical protein
VKSLEEKMTKALDKMEAEKAQASSAKMKTVLAVGGSILGALLGRKSGLSAVTSVLGGATATAATSAWNQGKDVANAETALERLKIEYEALNREIEDQTQKIRDQYDPTTLVVQPEKISPKKKDIQANAVGILWLPHERVGSKLRKAY